MYLYAWHRLDLAYRALPVHVILAAEKTGAAVELPAQIPTFNRNIGRRPGKLVKLLLPQEAAWVPEYYDCTVLEQREDRGILVEMPVPDDRWLVRLLRRLGHEAVTTCS